MNYRHDYHAGNFADVAKHALLTRILLHLAEKPTAFRVIETHSGSGLYDLTGPEAGRTQEWRDGVGKVMTASLAPEERRLVDSYLCIVRPFVGAERPRYPGSPLIAQAVSRPQDRLIFCELHPEARLRLVASLGRDRRAKVVAIDGYTGLNAFVPPIERRGLVLIDPPFEAPDEFIRLFEAVETAWRKWATGIYMIWYPVKDRRAVAEFGQAFVRRGIKRVLRLELQIDAPRRDGRLARTGFIVVNPPYGLEAEARDLLRGLGRCLARGEPEVLVEGLVGE